MNRKKIIIEKRISKKEIKFTPYIAILFIVIFCVTLYTSGFNLSAKITLFLGIYFAIFPILIKFDPTFKEKYLSEIHITDALVSLIYKVAGEVVEEKHIEKSEIKSFRIDIKINETNSFSPSRTCIYTSWGFLIKLTTDEYITNYIELNNDFKEARAARIKLREEIKRTKDKDLKEKLIESYEFFCKLDDDYADVIIKETAPNGYNFVFDFISCKESIPNCELNIDIDSPVVEKEINYYTKYGKKLPLIQKFFFSSKLICILLIIFGFIMILAHTLLMIILKH